MHEERVMEHYESCSQETIKNAISIYKDMKVISIEKEVNGALVEELVNVIISDDKVRKCFIIKLIDLEN